MVYAQARVRQARVAADLGAHVTLDACRHGGMTELGDAELVEQGVMALSGHKTPQAARLYMKRTEAQRITAARKRRSWVEKKGA
jgi:integrase